jgi:uncharacterized protein (TIGR02466 family)
MNTYQLLFPTPIAIIDAPKVFKEDHESLLNSEYHYGRNKDFLSTTNTYILKGKQTPLSNWLKEQIDLFARDFMATTKKLRITQSWCLKHEGIPHNLYTHAHSNSIISGAYYVHATENAAGLQFHKNIPGGVSFIQNSFDEDLIANQPWAWEWHEIPVQTGRLVLFPSYLQHGATKLGSTDLRCVLSFNTWYEGSFGDASKLTEVEVE